MCEVLPPLSIVSCVCVRVWIYARSKIWHTTTSSDRSASEPKLMMPSPAEENPLFQHWTVSTQRVSKRAEPSGASWLMILSINKGFWTVVWPSHRRRRVRADFGSGRLAGGAGTDLITNLFRLFEGGERVKWCCSSPGRAFGQIGTGTVPEVNSDGGGTIKDGNQCFRSASTGSDCWSFNGLNNSYSRS